MTWLRWIPTVGIALALACGGDDDGTSGETAGEGSTTAPTTSATTTTTATTDGSGSGESSATTTTATTTTVGESSDSGGSTDASSGGTDTGGGACGDAVCGGDQICVLPCCGGPAPPCIDMPEGGCDPEDQEVPADQCNAPCTTPMCCIDNCVADPPFCANTADLMCSGTSCNLDQCFGELSEGQLLCQCA